MEWKRLGFTKEKQKQFLEDFCIKPLDKFIQDGKNAKQQSIWQNQQLLLQCVVISLEDEGHEMKFLPFLKFLEEGSPVLGHDFYDKVLLTIIKEDNGDLLQEVLEQFSKYDYYEKYLEHLKINSPVLKRACRKGNSDMIKVLVKEGCRLKMCGPDSQLKDLSCPDKSMPTFFNGSEYIG